LPSNDDKINPIKAEMEEFTQSFFEPIDMNDISNEIQESVNRVLSMDTDVLERRNSSPLESEDDHMNDVSVSSLSTAQDMLSDYLSTSNERFSSFDKDEEEEADEKAITSDKEVKEMMKGLEAFSEPPEIKSCENENEDFHEALLTNNFSTKRRKLSDNRRKSISVLKRINETINDDQEIVQTTSAENAQVAANTIDENDDIFMTINPPKPTDEPELPPMNPKKRRVSNLPVPSMTVMTRSMRRQTMAVSNASLVDNGTLNLNSKTPNNATSKENQDDFGSFYADPNVKVKKGILSESSGTPNLISAKIIPATEKTTKKTSNKNVESLYNKENIANTPTYKISKEVVTKQTKNQTPRSFEDDINIDWLSSSSQKPAAILKSKSVDTGDENVISSNSTQKTKETRRMSIAKRRNSLIKITAMLDSVSENVNNIGISSFSVENSSSFKPTTISARSIR
jgi:hypothetical protein